MEIRIPLQQFAREQTVMEETQEVLGKVYGDLLDLSARMSRLDGQGEDTIPEEERIRYADDIRRIADELEEELRAVSVLIDFLGRAARIYRRAEERITDRYNLEDRIYPETVFGTSQ